MSRSFHGAGKRARPSLVAGRGGSIIILVMVTLLFTSAALVAFLDRAGTDLMVDARSAQAARLRPDAYSALEVTLAVLQDFRRADGNQLRAPSEGWSDPLGWAGWTPSDPNHTVEVSFQDESAKIPLLHADQPTLLNLFESVGYGSMAAGDAQKLVDGILGWIRQDYTPASAIQPDYQQSVLPYAAPGRSPRSMSELAAIDTVRDVFFDADGRPNDLWWQFYSDFSLFNFGRVNINAANADVLTAVGQFDTSQEQGIASYLAGTSQFSTLGRKWFQTVADLQVVTGPAGNLNAFAFTIRALRINITVHEGNATYTLSTVVAPAQGGASDIMVTATDVQKNSANATNASGATAEPATTTTLNTGSLLTVVPNAAQTSAAAKVNIQFPFTVLEIRENDEILVPPPPPVDPLAPAPPAATPALTPLPSPLPRSS
jgi:Type II secretion system (T2SS), protein K